MEKKILYSRSHRLRFDNFVLPLKHFNKAQTILCFKNPRKTLFRFLHFYYPRNCHAYFIRQPLFFFFFFYFSDFFEVNEADNRWIHDDEKRN